VRRVERSSVLGGVDALQRLEGLMKSNSGDAPVLHSTSSLTGRVAHGFSMSLGGNIWMYGYASDQGLPVLAASVGQNPDDQLLVSAFTKLHREARLILVDWKQQLVLVGVDASGQIEVWRP
jgi:hypothetical protein